MAGATMGMAYRQIKGLFGGGSVLALEDGQLLARYEAERDEAAFEALIGRHGPMVLTTCRAVLRDEHDAEDAFQATFLVLARKAGSVRGDDSLGGWLHRVAYRSSVQASVEARRRRRKEAEAAMAREQSSFPESEQAASLHEEIDRLPEGQRLPVVLCDLEGLTYEQAARQLGWTVPTLRNRLARARQRLKDRLTRRGAIAPTVAAMPAAVPAALARTTLSAATGGLTSAGASILTQTILKGMLMTRIKLASAAGMATLALASAGVIALAGGRPAEDPKPDPKPQAEAAARPEPAGKKPAEFVEVRGIVVAPDGKPVAGAAVRGTSYADGAPSFPEATSGPDGRFTIRIPKPRPEILALVGAEFQLFASASGHGVGQVEGALRADRPAEQVVTLTPEGLPIEGRIIDLEGRPVAGASVKTTSIYYAEKGDLPAWIARARNGAEGNLWQGLQNLPIEKLFAIESKTDANGRFTLTGIGRDRIAELLVTGPGIATTQVHVFSRAEADIRSADRPSMGHTPFIVHAPKFQLALMPSKRVEGVARDKDTSRPIAGLQIGAAVYKENDGRHAPGIEATTDAEGRYRLDGLPRAAAYQLFVKPGKGLPYPNAALKARASTPGLEPTPFDFTLKRGVVVRGKLTAKVTGRPILGSASYYALLDNPHLGEFPGIQEARQQYVAIEEDGSYELVALPGPGLVAVRDDEGRYRAATGFEKIHGYQPEYQTFNTAPYILPANGHNILSELVIDPGNPGPITLDLQADPGKSLAIDVVDPDGRPLAGTKVKGVAESYLTNPFPQEKPRVEIHAIDPSRPRRVVIQHDERKLIGSVLLKGDEAGPITVKLQPWGSVAGRVVDDEGKPRKGMFLSAPDGNQNKHPETDDILPGADWNSGIRVGDDGRFVVEGLVPGLKYAAKSRAGFEAFGDLFEGVAVAPGEARDLGDLKVKLPNPEE
jgi:RNA polymerase sigma factor (sigma-70 family)